MEVKSKQIIVTHTSGTVTTVENVVSAKITREFFIVDTSDGSRQLFLLKHNTFDVSPNIKVRNRKYMDNLALVLLGFIFVYYLISFLGF